MASPPLLLESIEFSNRVRTTLIAAGFELDALVRKVIGLPIGDRQGACREFFHFLIVEEAFDNQVAVFLESGGLFATEGRNTGFFSWVLYAGAPRG